MSGDFWRRLAPGRMLPRSAELYNRMADAARELRDRQMGGGAPALRVAPQPAIALVQNTTGDGQDRFAVLALGDEVFTPLSDDELPEFQQWVVVEGSVPALATELFGVLLEPADQGSEDAEPIVRAVVAGATPCMVKITDPAHNFAAPTPGVTAYLTSAPSGPAAIIARTGYPADSTSQPQWCYVLLGAGGAGAAAAACRPRITWVSNVCVTTSGGNVTSVSVERTTYDFAACGVVSVTCATNPTGCCPGNTDSTVLVCGAYSLPASLCMTVRTWNGGASCSGPTPCASVETLCRCYNLFTWLANNQVSLGPAGGGNPVCIWHASLTGPAEQGQSGRGCQIGFNLRAVCQGFTGNKSTGSNIITNVKKTDLTLPAGTTGMVLGGPVSGNGIPAGSTITSMVSNAITISNNCTVVATDDPFSSVTFDYGGNYQSADANPVGITFNGGQTSADAYALPTSTWSPLNLVFHSGYDSQYGLGCYTITPGCGAGAGGGISTLCCPSRGLPTTLYATVTGTPAGCACLSGAVFTLSYNQSAIPGAATWEGAVTACGTTFTLVLFCPAVSGGQWVWNLFCGGITGTLLGAGSPDSVVCGPSFSATINAILGNQTCGSCNFAGGTLALSVLQ